MATLSQLENELLLFKRQILNWSSDLTPKFHYFSGPEPLFDTWDEWYEFFVNTYKRHNPAPSVPSADESESTTIPILKYCRDFLHMFSSPAPDCGDYLHQRCEYNQLCWPAGTRQLLWKIDDCLFVVRLGSALRMEVGRVRRERLIWRQRIRREQILEELMRELEPVLRGEFNRNGYRRVEDWGMEGGGAGMHGFRRRWAATGRDAVRGWRRWRHYGVDLHRWFFLRVRRKRGEG